MLFGEVLRHAPFWRQQEVRHVVLVPLAKLAFTVCAVGSNQAAFYLIDRKSVNVTSDLLRASSAFSVQISLIKHYMIGHSKARL